jgi:hypothetical protein
MFGRDRKRLSEIPSASVVLVLDNKQSIAGILSGVFADAFELRGARLLIEGSGAHGIDGTVIVPRARVAWIQHDVKIDDARMPT